MVTLAGGEISGQGFVRSRAARAITGAASMANAGDEISTHDGLLCMDPMVFDPYSGLQSIKHENFGKPGFVKELVEELALQNAEGQGEGLVVFKGVDRAKYDSFVILTRKKDWKYKVRITWFEDDNLLVIKNPTAAHEAAAGGFQRRLYNFLANRLGVQYEDEIQMIGAATCSLGNCVTKEADAAVRLMTRQGTKPILVIEVGLSESLRRLRNDAFLWLERSGGAVKVVIVIKIVSDQKKILLEKWTCVVPTTPRPVSRSNPDGRNPFPTRVQNITIEQINTPTVGILPQQIQSNDNRKIFPTLAASGTTARNPATTGMFKLDSAVDAKSYRVVGAPLLIEFTEIFDRNPAGQEGDMVITGIGLAALGREIFRVLT